MEFDGLYLNINEHKISNSVSELVTAAAEQKAMARLGTKIMKVTDKIRAPMR